MLTIKDTFRRVYREIVRRRTNVQFLPPERTQLEERPIFLVGIYRSGTTLARYVLDSHSRITCPPETAFMAGLADLLSVEKYHNGFDSMGFDDDHVVQQMREFTNYFMSNYARAKGKPRWADKSPNCVGAMGFVEKMFPEAQFIVIHRHGLDQAHSWSRGGTLLREQFESYCQNGEDLRIGALKYWCDESRKILEFYASCPKKCHVIQYEKMCASPEPILKEMFRFLDEPWEPRVLQFYEFPHDKGAEDGRAPGTKGFDVHKEYYKDWSASLRAQCIEIAKPILKELGYSL